MGHLSLVTSRSITARCNPTPGPLFSADKIQENETLLAKAGPELLQIIGATYYEIRTIIHSRHLPALEREYELATSIKNQRTALELLYDSATNGSEKFERLLKILTSGHSFGGTQLTPKNIHRDFEIKEDTVLPAPPPNLTKRHIYDIINQSSREITAQPLHEAIKIATKYYYLLLTISPFKTLNEEIFKTYLNYLLNKCGGTFDIPYLTSMYPLDAAQEKMKESFFFNHFSWLKKAEPEFRRTFIEEMGIFIFSHGFNPRYSQEATFSTWNLHSTSLENMMNQKGETPNAWIDYPAATITEDTIIRILKLRGCPLPCTEINCKMVLKKMLELHNIERSERYFEELRKSSLHLPTKFYQNTSNHEFLAHPTPPAPTRTNPPHLLEYTS